MLHGEFINNIAEIATNILELLGISIIFCSAIYSTFVALCKWIKKVHHEEVFDHYRRLFAHGILLGLEVLVAADIIHTVGLELTFKSLGLLAIIIGIRTFLSFTLEVETSGKWPWQKKEK